MLLLFFSCTTQEQADTEVVQDSVTNFLSLNPEQLKSFELTAVEIEDKLMTQTLRLSGTIEVSAQNLISISSAYGGYVKSTKLTPGMSFKKGQVLAELEDNQYIQLQQDYLNTKAQLINAEAEYKRQATLNENKVSSDKVFQQAKADYQILLINNKALEEKLRLIGINPAQVSVNSLKRTVALYAPFDGFVSQIFVNTGKYVSPSDVLFELINPKDLMLNVKVFEKDWDKVRVGQEIKAFTNSEPDKIFKTQVSIINKNIDNDRAMNVYAVFKGSQPGLIPGLYMNAELIIPDANAPSLPEESILTHEGKQYVFEIQNNNTFKLIEVKTGDSDPNGWIEIVNSEQLRNKKIAHKGAYTLLMALKNKPEEE